MYLRYRRRRQLVKLQLEGLAPIVPFESLSGQLLAGVPRTCSSLLVRLIFMPTFRYTQLRSFLLNRPWYSTIDEVVIVSALPRESDIDSLYRHGVRGVINLCDETEGPCVAFRRAGFRWLHLPTIDYTAPTLKQIDEALRFIDEHAGRNERVVVNCKAGRGRSATVAICHLMRRYRLTPVEAQRWLLRQRPQVSRELFARPVVLEFHKTLSSTVSVAVRHSTQETA